MNKNSIYIILFFFTTNILLSQYKTERIEDFFKTNETDSLYITAIKNYTQELDSLITKNQYPKIIYLEHQNYLSRLPKEINGYQIISLGLANRKEYFKKNTNKLALVEISPLFLKDGLFSITLLLYGAKLKGKMNLDLSFSHFNRTYFKFTDGKLVEVKNETGGI